MIKITISAVPDAMCCNYLDGLIQFISCIIINVSIVTLVSPDHCQKHLRNAAGSPHTAESHTLIAHSTLILRIFLLINF
jgi:hypothetical protein